MSDTLTWQRACLLDPRLRDLATMARSIQRVYQLHEADGSGTTIWYRIFKPILVQWIGWDGDTKEPELRTSGAYDLVYERIYNVLCGERHFDYASPIPVPDYYVGYSPPDYRGLTYRICPAEETSHDIEL